MNYYGYGGRNTRKSKKVRFKLIIFLLLLIGFVYWVMSTTKDENNSGFIYTKKVTIDELK